MANGGRIFTEAEARKNLVDEARRMSVRTVQDRAREEVLFYWQPWPSSLEKL